MSILKKSNRLATTITEKDIERDILAYLSYIPRCFVWKQNNIGVFDPIKKVFRRPNSPYIINGVADILGVYNSMFIAIEVKSKRGRQSDSQKLFQRSIEECGGRYLIARSVDDVQEFFLKLKKINNNY